MEEEKTWGGKRKGAGRPIEAGEVKKKRGTRATDAEWELMKAFEKLCKKDYPRAKKILTDNNII